MAVQRRTQATPQLWVQSGQRGLGLRGVAGVDSDGHDHFWKGDSVVNSPFRWSSGTIHISSLTCLTAKRRSFEHAHGFQQARQAIIDGRLAKTQGPIDPRGHDRPLPSLRTDQRS